MDLFRNGKASFTASLAMTIKDKMEEREVEVCFSPYPPPKQNGNSKTSRAKS